MRTKATAVRLSPERQTPCVAPPSLTVSRSSRQLLATVALLSLIAAPVLAYQRQADEPLAFVAVPGAGASVVRQPDEAVSGAGRFSPDDRLSSMPPARPVDRGVERPIHRPSYVRPIVPLPPNPVRVVHVGAVGGSSGHAVSGIASYYCNADPSRGRTSRCTVGHPDVGGDQLYAAIRRDLLDQLRGRRVRVCATGSRRCVEVQVIDCNCGPSANLIDLYADALERLVPVSRGTVNVLISW